MSRKLRTILILLSVTVCISAAYFCGEARQQDKPPGAVEGETVFTQSQVDEKAIIDHKSRVKNFPSAQGCQGHGSVLLRVVLHKSGKVTDVEVRRADECKQFVDRATKAVRKVKFIPAKKDGVTVSQYATFQYDYNVQ